MIKAIVITEDNFEIVAALIGYSAEDVDMEARYLLENNRGAVATVDLSNDYPFCTGIVSQSLFDNRFTAVEPIVPNTLFAVEEI